MTRKNKGQKSIADTESSKMSEAAYDWLAPKYDDVMMTADYAVPDWFKAQVGAMTGLRPKVLDLGCGTGLVGQLLEDVGVKPERLFGIDVSTKMLEITKSKGKYTSLLQADLSRGLPIFESSAFDMITAFGLFEFAEDLNAIFEQIHKRLVGGGEVFCSFDLKVDSDIVKINFPGGVITRRPKAKSEILNLIKKHKFEIQQADEVSGYRSPSTGNVVPYLLVRAQKR